MAMQDGPFPVIYIHLTTLLWLRLGMVYVLLKRLYLLQEIVNKTNWVYAAIGPQS